MKTISAIYEDGVFKPTDPVDLPDHCRVQFEPVPVVDGPPSSGVDLSEFCGLLKDSPIDPLEYQRAIRAEWDHRP